MENSIWVLDDGRAGTTKQAIALAQAIGIKYEIKPIGYNFLSFLPNIFFVIKPFHLKNKIEDLSSSDFPKLIITAGRKNAPLALYIKKLSQGKTKVVQIMKPDMKHDRFDLIILPEHDQITNYTSNIVKIIGALCETNITYDCNQFIRDYKLQQEFIGVLIGGNSKNYKFSLDDAQDMIRYIETANQEKLPLFISFSRRTPNQIKNLIKAKFTNEINLIYDFEEGKYNPYLGILSNAKFIVTTADSISICSEVASTGKSFFIYLSDNFHSKKHRLFINKLFELKIARKLDKSCIKFKEYNYKPLHEAAKIAKIIKETIITS